MCYLWHGSMQKYCHSSQRWMTAVCKLLSFASVILAVSPYCLALCYCWFWSQGAGVETWRWVFLGTWEGNMAWATWTTITYHFWLLMQEVRLARFVAKTSRMCSGLVVLKYLTWEMRLLLLSLERWETIADLRHKNTCIRFLELQVVSGTVSLPRFR